MLRFRILGFPIVVEPWFWLSAAFFGGALHISGMGPQALVLLILNMAMIFISILVHELGHGLAFRRFGSESEIRLHGFGGVCISPRAYNTRLQSIIVSASGPGAGFLLAGVSWLLLQPFDPLSTGLSFYVRSAIAFSLYINIVWSLFNLLPILPMDGGQIMREILGPSRMRLTYQISGWLAVAIAVYAIYTTSIYLTVLMVIFAVQNFRNVPMLGGTVHPDSIDSGWAGSQRGRSGPAFSLKNLFRRKPKLKIVPGERGSREIDEVFKPGASVPQAVVDQILEKVANQGIGSLTTKERQLLEKHSNDLKKRAGKV